MDQEKLNAMADIMAQGHEVEFDSPEEAKAVQTILQARQGAKHAESPAAPIHDINAAKVGATTVAMDYAPAATAAIKSGLGDQSGYRSRWDSMMQHMSPEVKDQFIKDVSALPDKERWSIMRDLVKMNYQKDIEKNQSDRKAAQISDPRGYAVGQMLTGTALGMAGGMAAGPSIAGQGLAGMATGAMMDPSAQSALAGGAAGVAGAAIPNMIGSGLRKTGNAMSTLSAADHQLADFLELDPKQILALKSNPATGPDYQELMDVMRAQSPLSGPQQMLENIQMPAIKRGAQGTMVNPEITSGEKVGQIPATMDPMPVQQAKPQHPNSWMKPSGAHREIDLDVPPGDVLSDYHGVPNTYQQTSSQELNDLMPAHPSASNYAVPPRKTIPPPGPQEVNLDVIEQPQTPPLSPQERLASEQLAKVAGKNKGLVFQTPGGMVTRSIANRVSSMTGIGIPELGNRMVQLLDNEGARSAMGGAIGGMSSMGRDKLKQLIGLVVNSDDPSLEDYLAQESDPSYRALRMEADNERREQDNQSKSK